MKFLIAFYIVAYSGLGFFAYRMSKATEARQVAAQATKDELEQVKANYAEDLTIACLDKDYEPGLRCCQFSGTRLDTFDQHACAKSVIDAERSRLEIKMQAELNKNKEAFCVSKPTRDAVACCVDAPRKTFDVVACLQKVKEKARKAAKPHGRKLTGYIPWIVPQKVGK